MARITVIAGTNGAGKSSIAGQAMLQAGGDYFNPDKETRAILAANPYMTAAQSNAHAWQEGVRRLRDAITHGQGYAFETTLGGQTITHILLEAAQTGHDVRIWFCGLDTPERHLARIASRVAHGGHDIPEGKVRERYDSSRLNLIELMPYAREVIVYDNSAEADPALGHQPAPVLVLRLSDGRMVFPSTAEELRATPKWAESLIVGATRREVRHG